jgi:uncharacterized membrane protein YidH (DUF202 family)
MMHLLTHSLAAVLVAVAVAVACDGMWRWERLNRATEDNRGQQRERETK